MIVCMYLRSTFGSLPVFTFFYTPFLRKKREHVKRTCEAGAFPPLQNDVFVVCVVFQHEHGRDREHHAEEGCRAGAAGRGADHRRATEVRARASALGYAWGRAGVARTGVSDSSAAEGRPRAHCSRSPLSSAALITQQDVRLLQ